MGMLTLGTKTTKAATPTITLTKTTTSSKKSTTLLAKAAKFFAEKEIYNVPKTTITKAIPAAAVATGLVLGAKAVGAAVAAKGLGATAAAVVPKTIGGKAAAAVAAPIIVGAVVREPKATAKAAISAPKSLANVGGNIATAAANPSKENVTNIIKENPKTTAALAVGGLVAAGAAASGAVGAYLTHSEMKAQTAAFERQAVAAESALKGGTIPTTTAAAVTQNMPLTAATKSVEVEPIPSTTQSKKMAQNGSIPSISIINKNTSTGIRQSFINHRRFRKR